MRTIGSYTFSVFKGDQPIADQGTELEPIERRGSSGTDYRSIGTRPMPASYSTVSTFTSAPSRRTAKANYNAMQGTAQTMTDAFGESYDVIVKKVRITKESRAAITVGPDVSGNFLLMATFELEPASP